MKKELRNKKIDVRFTESEYKSIEELEQTLGIGKTELVRCKVLENSNTAIINSKELIAQLGKIGAELGRSGNNINQLAHYTNILKLKDVLAPDIVERASTLFELYISKQQTLEGLLRKIIRLLKY
jgi:hypothetical protein